MLLGVANQITYAVATNGIPGLGLESAYASLTPPHQARLADAAVLVVVPDHDLVGRVAWVAAAADEGEDVAAEEHLDDPNPAVGKVCGTTGQLTSRVRLRCVWIRGGTREADRL